MIDDYVWANLICGLIYSKFRFHRNTLNKNNIFGPNREFQPIHFHMLGWLLRLSLKLRHSKAKDQALPLGQFNPKCSGRENRWGTMFFLHQKCWALLQRFPSSIWKNFLQARLKKEGLQEKSRTTARSASTGVIPVIQLNKCIILGNGFTNCRTPQCFNYVKLYVKMELWLYEQCSKFLYFSVQYTWFIGLPYIKHSYNPLWKRATARSSIF